MRIQEYLKKREKYMSLPDNMDSMGTVADSQTKNELIIGVSIHRDVYSKTGYICNEDAPDELHACVCSLLEQIHEMAIIKTVLLKPEMIYEPICDGEEPTESLVRYSHMVLCALNEVFKGILAEQKENKMIVLYYNCS